MLLSLFKQKYTLYYIPYIPSPLHELEVKSICMFLYASVKKGQNTHTQNLTKIMLPPLPPPPPPQSHKSFKKYWRFIEQNKNEFYYMSEFGLDDNLIFSSFLICFSLFQVFLLGQ